MFPGTRIDTLQMDTGLVKINLISVSKGDSFSASPVNWSSGYVHEETNSCLVAGKVDACSFTRQQFKMYATFHIPYGDVVVDGKIGFTVV